MGLFNVLGNIASSAIKVVATPVAIIADVVDTATGNEPKNTKKLVKSIGDDFEDSLDELSGEKL